MSEAKPPTTTSTVPRRKVRRNSIRVPSGASMAAFNQRAPLVLAGGVAASSSQKHVADMKNSREKEKKAMQGLNSKLANHLETKRMLEAENKHLKELLNKSRVEFNIDKVKTSYEDQLHEMKALLEDKDKELATVKSQNESLEEEVEDLSEQLRQVQDERDRLQAEIDGLHDEVAHRIADSETSRRRTSELEKQLADWKKRYGILDGQMAELRTNLRTETSQRLQLEHRLAMLEDEIAFLDEVHNTEIKEYKAIVSKTQKLPDFQDSWKAEVGNIVSDLSAEYESQLQTITAAMESRHADEIQKLKAGVRTIPGGASPAGRVGVSGGLDMRSRTDVSAMREYESTISSLKSKIRDLEFQLQESLSNNASEDAAHRAEIDQLRAEMESMLKELHDLMDAKLSLELEIAAYRKLLDGEENRISSALSSFGGFQTEGESALANALSLPGNKMTMSRSTNGTVAIVELESEGRYIEIEDHAKFPKSPTNIKNWTLTQRLENGKTNVHTFTNGDVFSVGKNMVKVWGSKHGSGQDGIVSSVAEWSKMTMPSVITLKDDKGKESAVLTIKSNA
ncbi:70 kDa neurofilament protein-like isoform X2 [Octopus sinensis]|uniref:70 kDa neurofilament protein-like isoform X2 n=1 Tax=Octopus sinensis TaxID=2607531 RepID=A0A7E6FIZ4_9MOLL|nr:70 kDa neurofilament protein-like isoform X2 [Octopus sinensis]